MLPDIVRRLFPQKGAEKRVLIIGLDAAGKTTFLYRLHLGEIVTTIPTIGFNVESIRAPTSGKRGPLSLTCWDVGGCDKIRPLLRHYTQGTDAFVWVLDSNDRERMPEAREELWRMMSMVEEDRGAGSPVLPCLILANKQDLPGAMGLDEVRDKMGSVSRRSCAVFATSLVADDYIETLTPAMDWLYDALNGIVHFGMQSMPRVSEIEDDEENKDFCRFLLLNPYVADGNLWADYYTKGVIMTPAAKEQMVLPDKKPLPNLIARDSVRK
ncbi:hypothetical protein FRC07_014873 [Ceratobasidium sp. 392]|nr:hypothetical protein FRC07_014873 [Ceratobasidium sp. 392]